MKVYNPKASCPKCGHTTVSTFYLSAYLTRNCQRCNHTWEELPLDYKFNSDEERMEAYKDIPISTTPPPEFIDTTPRIVGPTDMQGDYDVKVDLSTVPACWCGRGLDSVGIPDFIGDNSPDAVCTFHYECSEHGLDYTRKPYAGIAISGKARSGKSTLADMLVERLGKPWHIESISDPIMIEWCEENKPVFYAEHGPDAALAWVKEHKEDCRLDLIELGQRRRESDPFYWLSRLPGNPNAIVPNCRFRQEYNQFRNRDFYMVRVDALPEVREARGCPDLDDLSENDLDSIPLWHWDYVAYNNDNLAGLDYQANGIVQAVLRGMKPDCQCKTNKED